MYLHTRLLLGIAAVTLVALLLCVLVPLGAERSDVGRETAASLQLSGLLLSIGQDLRTSRTGAEALAAARLAVDHAPPLRHVRLVLVDASGRELAASAVDERREGWLAGALLGGDPRAVRIYPLTFAGAPLGALRISSNPLSEISEIQQRAASSLMLLVAVIVALALAVYFMVRRGLRPVAQIQAALTQLQSGQLATRLPHFHVRDLDGIADSFNHCAQAMQETAEKRRELMLRLIGVQEEERKRLARELHDELGQSLTAIKVDAAYIAREAAGRSPKIEACVRGIDEVASGIMELIRGMLARLRPHELETVGLRETLQELVSGWQARMADRFTCSLAFSGPVNALSADLTITLYRLIQECLTNAVRHSRARLIAIHLEVEAQGGSQRPSRVSVRVEESEVSGEEVASASGGTGLLGMRERVEAQGGELRVQRLPNGALKLEAWMPAAPVDAAAWEATLQPARATAAIAAVAISAEAAQGRQGQAHGQADEQVPHAPA